MKTIRPLCLAICFVAIYSSGFCQPDTMLINNNIPNWVKPVLERSEMAQKHQILTNFNPFYFEGDFTGDGQVDIAFFVENKIDHSKGIMIINQGKNLAFVVGCGTSTDMGTSLDWAKRWFIYRNRYVMNDANKKKITLKLPAIQVIRNDTDSLVIYWNGKKYKTFVQQS